MALFWAKSAGPNQRARPLRVPGQAQQPFGDDVELHLRRATADGGGPAGQQNSPHLPGSSFGPIAASVPNEDRSSGLEVRLSTCRGEKMAVHMGGAAVGVPSVLLYRVLTCWIPVVIGWPMIRWLTNNEMV
jgi:hypothetical protein